MVANPGVAPELERRYGIGGVAIVPNYPVETGEIAPRDLRDLLGAEAIPANVAVVLYVGGIMAHRGVEELLDASSGLPEAHLVCLGAGGGITSTIEDEIRRRGLEDRVHLVAARPVRGGGAVRVLGDGRGLDRAAGIRAIGWPCRTSSSSTWRPASRSWQVTFPT